MADQGSNKGASSHTKVGHQRVPAPAEESSTGATASQSPPAPTPEKAISDARIGTLVDGRYTLGTLLGSGGQGDVYLATDTVLGCKRVLKFLKPAWAGIPDMRKRFAREARIAASLESPFVVPALDVAMEADPPYLVMPYCDGGSLSELIATKGRLSYTTTKRYLEHIAAGLATAHDEGYVHRDLKPANILLAYDHGTRELRARLLDFGTARDVEIDVTQITEEGFLVGTLSYMAPEFLMRANAELTHAADVFAVGQIAHVLLTGKKPRSRRSAAQWAAHYAALTGPCALDPLASLQLPGDEYVPPAFCDVIDRCLSIDPDERYADGHELYEALRHVERLASAKPGTIIDRRYQLKQLLGEGGQGVVWRARSLDQGCDVALKMMLPSDELPQEHRDYVLGRFQREADVLMQLRHPGVVRVLGQGRVGGDPYIVLELLDGKPLAKLRHRLDWQGVCELVTEVADALQAAHDAGVVHRDVKADNIVVTADGRVVLIDFGIARIPLSEMTGTAPVGTPGAMSPEQVSRPSDAGPAADQWGLAALVYRLLTGMTPGEQHPGELDGLTDDQEGVRRLHEAAVVPLSECLPELPDQVRQALERAMAYDPSQRHDTVESFAATLNETRDVDVQLYERTDESAERLQITPQAAAAIATERIASERAHGKRRVWAPVVAVALVVSAALGFILTRGGDAPSEPTNTVAVATIDAGSKTPVASPPAAPDAAQADKRTRLTIRTLRKKKPVSGVRLLVDGKSVESPVRIDREPGSRVKIEVVDRRYSETTKYVVVAKADAVTLVNIKRVGSSRRRPARPVRSGPEKPVVEGIIDMTKSKKPKTN